MSKRLREVSIWWTPIPGTAQEGFFSDDTPEAALLPSGGWGTGKTMTLTAKMLKLSALNAPLPVVWVVPRYDHIEKTILPQLEDIDEKSGQPWFLHANQFKYQPSKHILTWKGGGPIWFVSADHPESIAGPNVAAAGVDEPGQIDAKAWRNTIARVRHARAKLRQTVAAGTPEDLTWMQDLFFDPERPDRYKTYRMSTRENTELLQRHPEYLAQIAENATAAEIESYVEGRQAPLTGAAAYPMFEEAEHWTTVIEPTTNLPLLLSFDFNVNPMVCVIGQMPMGSAGPELQIIDAVVLYGGSTVDQTCDEILQRYPGWPAGVVIYGDASGRNRSVTNLRGNYAIIEDRLRPIGALRTKVPMSNPAVSSRLNAVNRLFKDANGRTRLWIRKTTPAKHATTRELIRSLQRTRKKTGTHDIDKPSGETHTHAADALGYLVATEFPIRKPDAVASIDCYEMEEIRRRARGEARVRDEMERCRQADREREQRGEQDQFLRAQQWNGWAQETRQDRPALAEPTTREMTNDGNDADGHRD